MEDKHRHFSHMYGLYPGNVLSARRTPQYVEAIKAVLEQRGDGGAGADRAAAEGSMSLAAAYQVLGVVATDSDEQITKAYRRQLSRHHPDKLKANGLPESMLEHAKARTQQIIEAWDIIRAARGIKS